MHKIQQKLIEFSLELIDIQIKKYQGLTKIGVGPDAKLNAAMVRNQVVELLTRLDDYLSLDDPSLQQSHSYAQHLSFFLGCEYTRARAGWLLDENTIHNPLYNRITEQRTKLVELMDEISLESPSSISLNAFQSQYQHDSYEVAFRILDLALRLQKDPEQDLGQDNNLGHGLAIMRKHAQPNGRYYQEDIASEIKQAHSAARQFIQDSFYEKSTELLEHDQATQYAQQDNAAFQTLFSKFIKLVPNSPLAASNYPWYQVGKPAATTTPNAKTEQSKQHNHGHNLRQWGLFAITATTVAAAVVCSDEKRRAAISSFLGLK